MKITAPKDPDEYFRQTDHGVKHSYAGLDSCWLYYRQALQHWDISQVGQPMTPERKAALDRYLELAGKYFDLKFSEAMFAGVILQVAYMAIRLYSRNASIPVNCSAFVRPSLALPERTEEGAEGLMGAPRLPDEALHGDESFGDGIRREEQTLQGYRPEQRGAPRRDEAGRGHFSSVDDETHRGDRPDLLAARGLNRLGAQRRELELVGKRAWDNEKRGASVHQQVYRRRPTRGTGETRGDAEQLHHVLILCSLHRPANVAAKMRELTT